ncbi:MAG: protein kinase [Myxococcota bacterium]|jgi:serine/threonine-protein kinase|nr:protein kinase [Myxococcota bacterium]
MDVDERATAGEGLLPCLGRYQLLRRLALGGMAEIYLARAEGAEGFAKPVVIKRILPDRAADPEHVALFVEEARLAARLNHAHITQVFDFAEEPGGGYYIAMEYVHGRDLREVLERCRDLDRRVGVPRAAKICVDVLEGLTYAHEFSRRGRPLEIVHRDISPRNILVGFNGDVKLTDFGIARARTSELGEEQGVVRGKLLYMAPEQIRGLPLDQRCDLYALGLVLYELLTGVRALEGPNGASIANTVRAEFPPAEALRPDLPPALAAILRRALARDREQRYGDGREFLHDLNTFLFSAVRSPEEIELPTFLASIFPEVVDLSVTVSSARALLIQRETSGLQLTQALRAALARRPPPEAASPAAPAPAVDRPPRTGPTSPQPSTRAAARPRDQEAGLSPDHGPRPPDQTRRQRPDRGVPSGRRAATASQPRHPDAPPPTLLDQPHLLAAAPLATLIDSAELRRPVSPPAQARPAATPGPRATPRWGPLLVLGLLLLGAAGTGFGLWRSQAGSPATPTDPLSRLATPPPEAPSPAAAARPPEAPAPAGVASPDPPPPPAPIPSPPGGPASSPARADARADARAEARAEAPASRPARPAPTSGEGRATCSLTVNAVPYAEVWVDGQGPRETPHRWTLPPGRHRVRLVNRAEGVVVERDVELAAGEHLQRTYEMHPR